MVAWVRNPTDTERTVPLMNNRIITHVVLFIGLFVTSGFTSSEAHANGRWSSVIGAIKRIWQYLDGDALKAEREKAAAKGVGTSGHGAGETNLGASGSMEGIEDVPVDVNGQGPYGKKPSIDWGRITKFADRMKVLNTRVPGVADDMVEAVILKKTPEEWERWLKRAIDHEQTPTTLVGEAAIDKMRLLMANLADTESKGNVTLTGAAGVGKTSFVEELAHRIAMHRMCIRGLLSSIVCRDLRLKLPLDPKLVDTHLVSVNLGAIDSGASLRGALEQNLKDLLDAATRNPSNPDDPKIVLFFDEAHALASLGASSEGGDNAMNRMKPLMASGRLRAVFATTEDEFRHLAKDDAFVRRAPEVNISELSEVDTLVVASRYAESIANEVGHIQFQKKHLQLLVKLAPLLLPAIRRPDNVKKLMRAIAGRKALRNRVVDVDAEKAPQRIESLKLANETLIDNTLLPSENGPFTPQWALDVIAANNAEIAQLRTRINEVQEEFRRVSSVLKEIDELSERIVTLKSELAAAALKKEELIASHGPGNLESQKRASLDSLVTEMRDKEHEIIARQKQIDALNNTYGLLTISDGDLVEAIAKIYDMPESQILGHLRSGGGGIAGMIKSLTDSVKGQLEIIEALVRSVVRRTSGISRADKPIGTFGITGPPGTGKTFIARELADKFFNGNLIRIDGNQFKERTAITRLTGASPGYVGYEQPGSLDAVIRRPRCVLLVDEFEKMSLDAQQHFMGIMDNGFDVNAAGKRRDFSQCVLIFTMNSIQTGFGKGDAELREMLRSLRRPDGQDLINPEVVNRMTRVLHTGQFTDAAQREILRIRVNEIVAGLRREKFVNMELDELALDEIVRVLKAAEGYRGLVFSEVELLASMDRQVDIVAGIKSALTEMGLKPEVGSKEALRRLRVDAALDKLQEEIERRRHEYTVLGRTEKQVDGHKLKSAQAELSASYKKTSQDVAEYMELPQEVKDLVLDRLTQAVREIENTSKVLQQKASGRDVLRAMENLEDLITEVLSPADLRAAGTIIPENLPPPQPGQTIHISGPTGRPGTNTSRAELSVSVSNGSAGAQRPGAQPVGVRQ